MKGAWLLLCGTRSKHFGWHSLNHELPLKSESLQYLPFLYHVLTILEAALEEEASDSCISAWQKLPVAGLSCHGSLHNGENMMQNWQVPQRVGLE